MTSLSIPKPGSSEKKTGKKETHFHLIGIGGIAMAQLAILLKDLGHQVTGSDTAVYAPVSEKLDEWEIPYGDFNPTNLNSADTIIVGNAIARGNQELEFALSKRLPLRSMSQILNLIFLQNTHNVVIAGTHGKTTTTLLIDHLLCHNLDLQNLDWQPGLFAGGFFQDGRPAARVSGNKKGSDSIVENNKNKIFIIEGDEYDTAFFDKGPKFLHYFPHILVIVSLEYDHIDIYPSYEKYLEAFRILLRMVPRDGLVIANGNYPDLRDLVIRHSLSPACFYCRKDLESSILKQIEEANDLIKEKKFTLYSYEKGNFPIFGKPNIPLAVAKGLKGDMNRQNISAALLAVSYILQAKDSKKSIAKMPRLPNQEESSAVALSESQHDLDLDNNQIQNSLLDFQGAMRRQETILSLETPQHGAFLLLEDFAHHPTAVKGMIEMLREEYPEAILYIFFEPRSNSSHHKMFEKDYLRALQTADQVYLCTPVKKTKQFAKPEQLDSLRIVQQLNNDPFSNQSKNRASKLDDSTLLNEKSRTSILAFFSAKAYYGDNPQQLIEYFRKEFSREGFMNALRKNNTRTHVFAFLSNGPFAGIGREVKEFLQGQFTSTKIDS